MDSGMLLKIAQFAAKAPTPFPSIPRLLFGGSRSLNSSDMDILGMVLDKSKNKFPK